MTTFRRCQLVGESSAAVRTCPAAAGLLLLCYILALQLQFLSPRLSQGTLDTSYTHSGIVSVTAAPTACRNSLQILQSRRHTWEGQHTRSHRTACHSRPEDSAVFGRHACACCSGKLPSEANLDLEQMWPSAASITSTGFAPVPSAWRLRIPWAGIWKSRHEVCFDI